MKEKELREFAKCSVCHEGVGKYYRFFKVTIEEFMLDPKALERQQGLTAFLGGSNVGAVLANIMGPNEDLALSTEIIKISVCDNCALKNKGINIYRIMEEKQHEI